MSLVWELWLVISGLCNDDWLAVLLLHLLLLHRLAVEVESLPDHDSSRVPSISKREGVFMLMNRDDCAAAQHNVEACLLFELSLHTEEGGFKGLLDDGVATIRIL
jgi:hypothetical protein